MSIKEIVLYPDPRLREKCKPVKTFGKRLEKLVHDMLETMHKQKGVGLAGPQVGVLDRVFVAEYEGRKLALINPEITARSGSEVAEEGCLSLPDVTRVVERSVSISVKAQTINGDAIEFDVSGFMARIIQHEMDHLDGVLIIDRSHIPGEGSR